MAIIGAGAAGLTAAIFARQAAPDARIVALDGAPRIGAKILISGGGRCNVTHDVVTPDDFNGNRNAIGRVLRTFTVEQTVRWFESIGVTLAREETGKLFPVTDRARTVVDALLRAADGVNIRTSHRVHSITPNFHLSCNLPSVGSHLRFSPAHDGNEERSPDPLCEERRSDSIDVGFSIQLGGMEKRRSDPITADFITARRVILATGGRSVPKSGSDGRGYAIARELGHTVTEVVPALVPLVLPERHWMTEISGTSTEAELSVRGESGRLIVRYRGSMLFTHVGLSGPVVLDISRHWIRSKGTLVANFLPGETFESLDARIVAETGRNPRATIASMLRGRLPERLLAAIAGGALPLGRLPRDERRRLVRALVEQVIPVVGDRGFDYAEVTAGGVPLSEVDLSTMASRRCEGLYLCGEILDVDGRIGGFNFQWAWASGRLAGLDAARSLHR